MRTCGLISTYNNGCRCEECKKAARWKRNIYRQRNRGNPPEHGTLNAYQNYACRCSECKATASARYRAKKGVGAPCP